MLAIREYLLRRDKNILWYMVLTAFIFAVAAMCGVAVMNNIAGIIPNIILFLYFLFSACFKGLNALIERIREKNRLKKIDLKLLAANIFVCFYFAIAIILNLLVFLGLFMEPKLLLTEYKLMVLITLVILFVYDFVLSIFFEMLIRFGV